MTNKGIVYGSYVVMSLSLIAIAYYGFLYFDVDTQLDFDYQQVATVGEEVVFSNISTTQDLSLSWKWQFGDGSPSVASFSAKHAFPAPGRYVVTLALEGDNEAAYKQKIIQITQPVLKSAFGIEASSIKIGQPLVISNNSQNATDFVWNLGDGRVLTGANPAITYPTSGSYELTLVAMNQVGQSDRYSLRVDISSEVNNKQVVANEVIVNHIAIFDKRSLSQAFSKLANTQLSRSEKRKIRNNILRDVSSINIMVDELSLENYLNKIQLEASPSVVSISVGSIERDANNKISKITIN